MEAAQSQSTISDLMSCMRIDRDHTWFGPAVISSFGLNLVCRLSHSLESWNLYRFSTGRSRSQR